MIRQTKKTRTAALAVALALLGALAIGGTLAYLIKRANTVTNKFEAGKIKIQIIETTKIPENSGEPWIKKDVRIQNNSKNGPVFVLAKIVASWKDEEGNVYPETPVSGEDYIIEYDADNWRNDYGNGYYLYGNSTNPVMIGPDSRTFPLIKFCNPIPGKAPDGYTLSIDILAQAIQAEPREEISQYLTPTTTVPSSP